MSTDPAIRTKRYRTATRWIAPVGPPGRHRSLAGPDQLQGVPTPDRR